jgi:hypothetical protein
MAKISRGPYRTFQDNLLVAQGFLKIQFYLRDLLTTGGKASIGVLQSFSTELMEAAGFGPGGLEALIRERIGPEVDARLNAADPNLVQRRINAWLKRNQGRFEEMVRTIKSVSLAYERGLPLQAIVVTTSAFEAYVQDTVVEAIASNAYIEKRFSREAEKILCYDDVKSSEFEAHRAVGRAALRAYDLSDAARLRTLLEKCLGSKVRALEGEGSSTYRRLLAYRNLAAHTAGIVDQRFKIATRYTGPVGEPVILRPGFVVDGLHFFEGLVGEIQDKLEKQRASR